MILKIYIYIHEYRYIQCRYSLYVLSMCTQHTYTYNYIYIYLYIYISISYDYHMYDLNMLERSGLFLWSLLNFSLLFFGFEPFSRKVTIATQVLRGLLSTLWFRGLFSHRILHHVHHLLSTQQCWLDVLLESPSRYREMVAWMVSRTMGKMTRLRTMGKMMKDADALLML